MPCEIAVLNSLLVLEAVRAQLDALRGALSTAKLSWSRSVRAQRTRQRARGRRMSA